MSELTDCIVSHITQGWIPPRGVTALPEVRWQHWYDGPTIIYHKNSACIFIYYCADEVQLLHYHNESYTAYQEMSVNKCDPTFLLMLNEMREYIKQHYPALWTPCE